jgi:hypothetical protein
MSLEEARNSLVSAAYDLYEASPPGTQLSEPELKYLCEAACSYAEARKTNARGAGKAAGGGSTAVFPSYGRSKGAPIAGAAIGDLEFYIRGCERTLADESKARWHEKERALLAVLRAELESQS